MKELRTKVTSKGQLTLPKLLRDSLGIREGDQVEFTLKAPANAILRKLNHPGSSAGILRHLAKEKPVAVAEMDEGIRESIRTKYWASS